MGGSCTKTHPCYHWDNRGDDACKKESCGKCHMEHGERPDQHWCVNEKGKPEDDRMEWPRTLISPSDVGILHAALDNKKWDDWDEVAPKPIISQKTHCQEYGH